MNTPKVNEGVYTVASVDGGELVTFTPTRVPECTEYLWESGEIVGDMEIHITFGGVPWEEVTL